ncbi:class I SAM-dependent methyltransferase [Calothrix rhizosoleniae]|uniref:class I SAM-dependent methyltransferase n=1 Tax=Calothrix rhizosoleniae TaxID=888997 RepID=UPI000B4A0D62|nr:class I SAM-dependent methyltransferase [Calothrix rhizosoleniae]
MTIARQIINIINRTLAPINLRLDSLTAEKAEETRLISLKRNGYFKSPVFKIPSGFNSDKFKEIIIALENYQSDLNKLANTVINAVGYTYDNPFFTSPDAEILYTMIRKFQPSIVLEVGCGNSTKITRQAILDGELNTKIVSIDPEPRTEISKLVDKSYLQPVETLAKEDISIFSSLQAGDILFIDSSHQLQTGNDVTFLYTQIIPELRPGVVIHIHDIFLPYDYPTHWAIEERYGFNEQYLVQCILTFSNAFEVLWAGHFLQHSLPDFRNYFPNLQDRRAQSLWLEKII